jgi:hypothetical protein
MEEGMSMEQFTLRKEAEMKARGAEIITIDGIVSASDTEVEYRPKVATWGVFPRPQNISEAFGGGRNIRPGQVGVVCRISPLTGFLIKAIAMPRPMDYIAVATYENCSLKAKVVAKMVVLFSEGRSVQMCNLS